MGSTLFRDPQALSSALTALGTLQPQAFRSLNRVDPLDSVSNLYIYRTLLNQSKYKTGSLHPLIPHLLLHQYVHWIKQLVCMPVTVHTKITTLGDIGAWKTCEANEYAEIGKKLASVYFKLFCNGHIRHKCYIFSDACRPHLLIGPRALSTCK